MGEAAALEEAPERLSDHRPPLSQAARKTLFVDALEALVVVEQHLVERRLVSTTRGIGRMDSNSDSGHRGPG
jgi:hypothetical protein